MVGMGFSRIDDEQYRLLRFWWMVELFNPQRVPALTGRPAHPDDRRVIRWAPGDPPPWKRLPPPKPRNGMARVWQHTVYLGVYDLEATYEWLHRMFGADKDAYDERGGGRSACAGLLVDEDGRSVPDSSVLSSALWAVARIKDPGPWSPSWADGFPQAQVAFAEAVAKYEDERFGQGREAPAHDTGSIRDLLRIAQRAAGISGIADLSTDEVVVQSIVVPRHRVEEAPDIDFLNSFYLDDLTAVRDHASEIRTGSALASYLTGDHRLDTRRRIDVRANPAVVDDGVSLDRLPLGRWPSNPDHGLALSQQFAVNHALNDLSPPRGLMGVNGPPGTGKTTMLRDILAGNVVERARRLASLPNPMDAFVGAPYCWKTGSGYPRRVPRLRPELTGFEMIVASANNAAVENVTVEIPAQDAIDRRWWARADYFGDIASAVLRETAGRGTADDGRTGDQRAWGMIAARLGKKRNRSEFRSSFWFDKGTWGGGESPADGAEIPRMQSRLTQWRDGVVPHKGWSQALKDFMLAEKRVTTLIDARRRAHRHLVDLQEARSSEHALVDTVQRARIELRAAEQNVSDHRVLEEQAQERLTQIAAQYDRHMATRPGVLETIFSLGRATRAWRASLDPLLEELSDAERRGRSLAAQGSRLRDGAAELAAGLGSLEGELSRTRDRLSRLRTECAEDKRRYGPAHPDAEQSAEQRELHAPWLDAELDTARSELFLAALQLHQDFFANTARTMLDGLRAACEVVAGGAPKNLEPEKVRAAWQLFFLVVPLVSTTFASCGRMLGGIGPEALGWLLIDEAGQASPQYAVGAIWRARRVVVVGDPLQLRPVVTIPQKAQHDIAAAHGISSTWIPPLASVQTLADRVSPYGTRLRQGEGSVWISAPLRVHRRCDEPMFTLCNEIAYDGIMINGVHRALDDPDHPDPFDAPDGPRIARSCWVDEPAPTPGSHLQENQVVRLEKILDRLIEHGVEASDVIAIAPFRDVADRLAALTSRYHGLRAGTIHTAQGREAPVVVLVLGGDPKRPGAKAWASSTVNLVNVAASRAQRRLYVIGDRASWAGYNYFHQLDGALTP